MTLATYTIVGWFLAIVLDYYGTQTDIDWLKNILLRIDLIGLLYIIIGYVFIFFRYWGKMNMYLNKVVEGIEIVYDQDDRTISLPEPLKKVEGYMNRIKMSVLLANKAAKVEENKKNEIVAYLAHDIRTPLTSIIGYLNLLNEVPDMDESKRIEYIQRVLERAEHLEELVNEFFEITQYNTGEVKLYKSSVDIHYMFLQLKDEFWPILNRNGNTLKLNMSGKIMAEVDADKLSRAFSNLIKNAIIYSFSNTEITISAKIVDQSLIVEINNKGKTIPPADLGRIFEKFNRLDSARRSDEGGAGLGLSIAKEIINLHGGSITVESVNNEITFVINMPFNK